MTLPEQTEAELFVQQITANPQAFHELVEGYQAAIGDLEDQVDELQGKLDHLRNKIDGHDLNLYLKASYEICKFHFEQERKS